MTETLRAQTGSNSSITSVLYAPDELPTADAPPPTKVTVLISGNGSNLQALIDATQTGLLPTVKIERVISNRKDAYGLERAREAGIPTKIHNLITGKYYAKGEKEKSKIQEAREKYDADLARLVLADQPDLVVCAGFMHVLTPLFLQPLETAGVPVINLHPALPKMYDGTHAIERAHTDFLAGKLERDTTGIMIHYVITQVDRGNPIIVKEIQCRHGESLDELTARIHEEEHLLIVKGAGLAIAELWEKRKAST